MKKHLLYTLILACALVACNHDMPLNPNSKEAYECANYTEQFDRVWQGLSESYIFWNWNLISWDSIYDEYHPYFEQADAAQRTIPDNEYRKTWNNILTNLIDHHMVVVLRNIRTDSIHQIEINLLHNNAQSRVHEGKSYYHSILSRDYEQTRPAALATHTVTSPKEGTWTSSNETWNMYSALIDGTIAYFYTSSCGGYTPGAPPMNDPSSQAKEDEQKSILEPVYNNFREMVLGANSPVRAMVVDTRSNQGGSEAWLSAIAGMVLRPEEALYVANNFVKAGPAPYDIMLHTASDCRAADSSRCHNVPIIFLVDVRSHSMGECLAWEARELKVSLGKNIIVMGEQTCGATGSVGEDFDNQYAGPFGDDNIASHPKSSYYVWGTEMATVDLRDELIEGKGVEPDRWVLCDTIGIRNHTSDNMLEEALRYAKTL